MCLVGATANRAVLKREKKVSCKRIRGFSRRFVNPDYAFVLFLKHTLKVYQDGQKYVLVTPTPTPHPPHSLLSLFAKADIRMCKPNTVDNELYFNSMSFYHFFQHISS